MYREVKLQEQDKDYHRFFLRNEDGKICEARMTRLTFGMRPSLFVATAVLRHHAELSKQEFPDASKAILSSFYVVPGFPVDGHNCRGLPYKNRYVLHVCHIYNVFTRRAACSLHMCHIYLPCMCARFYVPHAC